MFIWRIKLDSLYFWLIYMYTQNEAVQHIFMFVLLLFHVLLLQVNGS